jgi:alkylhydroperoxidase family enzyme
MREKGEFFFIGNNLAIDFANTVYGTDLWEALNSCDDVAAFLARGYARHEMPKSASPAEVVSAVRSNLAVPDPKLNALVALTKEIVSERGHVRAQTTENFLAAGYRKEQVLEVLIGVALKTISNYLDHISPTELDQAFQSEG